MSKADPRKPELHAGEHQAGGNDVMSIAGLSGESVTAQPPKTHASTHVVGGTDPAKFGSLLTIS